MTSVYVAGASDEASVCDTWMSRLRGAGFEIACDWVANIRAVGDANPRHASEEDRLRWTMDDVKSAVAADVFWLLVPVGATTGAWTELGVAWAARNYTGAAKTIIVSGDWRRTIFTSLADRRFESHDDAFTWLLRSTARYVGPEL